MGYESSISTLVLPDPYQLKTGWTAKLSDGKSCQGPHLEEGTQGAECLAVVTAAAGFLKG